VQDKALWLRGLIFAQEAKPGHRVSAENPRIEGADVQATYPRIVVIASAATAKTLPRGVAEGRRWR
jgi:hypothetical protein